MREITIKSIIIWNNSSDQACPKRAGNVEWLWFVDVLPALQNLKILKLFLLAVFISVVNFPGYFATFLNLNFAVKNFSAHMALGFNVEDIISIYLALCLSFNRYGIGFNFSFYVARLADGNACLLYTSPSPRD